MPWWISVVVHVLNTWDNDSRGFCMWTWLQPVGIYFACS